MAAVVRIPPVIPQDEKMVRWNDLRKDPNRSVIDRIRLVEHPARDPHPSFLTLDQIAWQTNDPFHGELTASGVMKHDNVSPPRTIAEISGDDDVITRPQCRSHRRGWDRIDASHRPDRQGQYAGHQDRLENDADK